MKSKLIAYILLIFLGWMGAHRFYIGKFGSGLIYLFTGGLMGIGLFFDLFTLGGKVDIYNALHMNRGYNGASNNVNTNTIIVNVDKQSEK